MDVVQRWRRASCAADARLSMSGNQLGPLNIDMALTFIQSILLHLAEMRLLLFHQLGITSPAHVP